jgi:hypothetical protein
MASLTARDLFLLEKKKCVKIWFQWRGEEKKTGHI